MNNYIQLEEVLFYLTFHQLQKYFNLDSLSDLKNIDRNNRGFSFAIKSTKSKEFLYNLLHPKVYGQFINLTDTDIKEFDSYYQDLYLINKDLFDNLNDIRKHNLLLVQQNSAKYVLYNDEKVNLTQITDTIYLVTNYLGGGAYGVALLTNYGVLKITTDTGEFDKSISLLNNRFIDLYYEKDNKKISVAGIKNYFSEIYSCYDSDEIDYYETNMYLCDSMIPDLSTNKDILYIIHKEYINGKLLSSISDDLEDAGVPKENVSYFDKCMEVIYEEFPELYEWDLHSGNVVIFPENSDVSFKFFDF